MEPINTLFNFKKWSSMVDRTQQTFTVSEEELLRSLTIKEADAGLTSLRVEMSPFLYPRFMIVETGEVITYNAALLRVLNYALSTMKYINEVAEHIKLITNHRVYLIGSNANLQAKNENTYVLVDHEFNSSFRVDDDENRAYANKLPIQPTSEKSVGDGVLVLSDKSLYKAVGYEFENGIYRSIFPNKSNLAARLKSFVIPTSVKLETPDVNCFKNGDVNTLEALTIFTKPRKEAFVSGEIWVEKSRFKDVLFSVEKRVYYTETDLEVGDIVTPQEAKIYSSYGEDTSLHNAVSMEVISKTPFYLRMKVIYRLNESRITSNTGIKGYSVFREGIGNLAVSFPSETVLLKPDLVCGPSSLKGKVNQIRLAQALFVSRYMEYNNSAGSIDSMDEAEINRLADLCPTGVWIDESGAECECLFGLVNLAFTDPSVQYTGLSYMNFQFEMMKVAMKEYPELAKRIQDARDPDQMEIIKEIVWLQESLNGVVKPGLKVIPKARFNVYNDPKSQQVAVINATEVLPVVNWLLDENREAFILQIAANNRIYVPTGKTLKSFQSAGANNQWLYDTMVVQLSRLFNRANDPTGLRNAVNRYVINTGNRAVLYPEILGVSMKQSTLYDHTMTASIPSSALKQAKRKIYGHLPNWESMELYGIASRNPSIWKGMFSIVKIIDGGKCNTVGISHDVVIQSRADNDSL